MAKYSIGAKIFAAFVAMSMLIAAIGLAGYTVLSAAGNIAVVTFDGPLMAISYARAAHTDFTEMQVLEQRFEQATPERRAAIAADINDVIATFNDDLDVAAQRANSGDESAVPFLDPNYSARDGVFGFPKTQRVSGWSGCHPRSGSV